MNLEQAGTKRHITVDITDWKLDSTSNQDLVQSLGFVPYRPEVLPMIAQVVKDSPAEQAGLKVGDEILAVLKKLKLHHIKTHHCVHQLLANWQVLESAISRERSVQYQTCVCKFATTNNILSSKEQIDAVEPEHVILGAGGMPQNHVCELIVNPLVCLPALIVERPLAVE